MKTVYIAHPLSAPTREGIEENRKRAALWAAWAALDCGVSPSCSWLVLTGVIDETPETRELGLACDLAAVARSDQLWLVGGRVSSGMKIEADAARAAGIPVRNFTPFGRLPPFDSPKTRALLTAEARSLLEFAFVEESAANLIPSEERGS